MDKIGVFVVDRQALFRQGLRIAFSQSEAVELIGECDLSEEVLPLLEAYAPRVVLVDVDLPSLHGIDLARRINQRLPGVWVILLTAYEDEDQLFQAIKAGAAAYLSKDVSAEELASVVTRVCGGEPVISESLLAKPRVAQNVLRQFQDFSLAGKAMETLAVPLTPREVEVLSYVARGNGNKQIAHVLSISEQTIKNHITSILRKLNANDRTHAVVVALRNGWISI